MKDVLSIWRLPSEVSYVFFLIGLAAFFFLLILYTGSFRYARAGLWGPGLLTFCLGWLLFFTTAFLLRLVFPLMARERPQAWYMFTLPLSSSRIVIAKVTAGLAVSAVFAVFAVVFWTIVPVSAWHKGILLMWSIWSICSLVIIHVALGMIHPNFDEGTEPERVSTSGQGMAALALSVMLTAAVCYVVYSILTQGTVPLRVWIFFVLLSAGMPMYLLTAAHKSVKEYEF